MEGVTREERARKLRLRFTPSEMLREDGSLNPEYFTPKNPKLRKTRKWTEKERGLLVSGIEKHGIGEWRSIREEFLPDWEDSEIRVKTARLMGRQSLLRYKNWKGDAKAIAAEYEKNKELGLRLGCWKSGQLVADDGGELEKVLAEQEGNKGGEAAK